MKKLIFTLMLMMTLVLVGCSADSIRIVEGDIEPKSNKTLTNIKIDVNTSFSGSYKLSPGVNSTLLDNLGNEYRVLKVKNNGKLDENRMFGSEIYESGTYSGTLVFPQLEEKANLLRLRIDEVKHYEDQFFASDRLKGKYVLTFNFELEENNDLAKNNNSTEKNTIRTQDNTYSLESIEVSNDQGKVLKKINPQR